MVHFMHRGSWKSFTKAWRWEERTKNNHRNSISMGTSTYTSPSPASLEGHEGIPGPATSISWVCFKAFSLPEEVSRRHPNRRCLNHLSWMEQWPIQTHQVSLIWPVSRDQLALGDPVRGSYPDNTEAQIIQSPPPRGDDWRRTCPC